MSRRFARPHAFFSEKEQPLKMGGGARNNGMPRFVLFLFLGRFSHFDLVSSLSLLAVRILSSCCMTFDMFSAALCVCVRFLAFSIYLHGSGLI